jgi:Helix-turn-helix domain
MPSRSDVISSSNEEEISIFFGPGHAVPMDRNAKCRIATYARAWSARNRRPRQHHGPITMAFERVLVALLWSFHNSRDGRCFPSYEAIAERAGCARSTVAEALKALEWAGVLSCNIASPACANAAPICSAASAGNGACIAAATPTHSVTRNSTPKGPPPISPKISPEHRTK